jgi:hypothetical protein
MFLNGKTARCTIRYVHMHLNEPWKEGALHVFMSPLGPGNAMQMVGAN